MKSSYPSSVTKEQFKSIEHHIIRSKNKTAQKKYDLYDVFCDVLYILREDCRWRALPCNFPKWQNCYKHYRSWLHTDADGKSVLDKIFEDLETPGS